MRSIMLKESYLEALYNCIVDCRSSDVLLDKVDRTGKTDPMLIKFPLLHIEGTSWKNQKRP